MIEYAEAIRQARAELGVQDGESLQVNRRANSIYRTALRDEFWTSRLSRKVLSICYAHAVEKLDSDSLDGVYELMLDYVELADSIIANVQDEDLIF